MLKIIEIIKNIFKKDKSNNTKLIEDKHINDNQRENFVKSIDSCKDIELSKLQEKLENNQISVNDINIFEVMDLIDKYEQQINELKRKTQNC